MPAKFVRTESKCRECPFRDSRRVWGCGPENARVVFIGEAPGEDEDRCGQPFVGWAGRFLRKVLFDLGVNPESVWLTNTISCRPPNNDIKSIEAFEAINCCRSGLYEELDALVKNGAQVIGTLGNTPLKELKLSTLGITKARGSVLSFSLPGEGPLGLDNIRTIPAVPTFHPSFLNRMRRTPEGRDPITYDAVWRADLRKIIEIGNKGWHPYEENFNINPTLSELESFVDFATNEKKLVGVDIETTGVDPHKDHIVVLGLSVSPDSAITIPILSQYGAYYWNSDEEPIVRNLVLRLFEECGVVVQYSPFDIPFLIAQGFDISPKSVVHDTYLMAIALGLPKLNLGFITSIYGTTPYWKEDFLGRTVPITYLPDEVLRTYNARDAVTLMQIYPRMLAEMDGTKLDLYQSYMRRLPEELMKKIDGAKIDPEKIDKYEASIKGSVTKIEKLLYDLGNLPPQFNLQSGDDLRYFIYGEMPSKFKELDKKIAEKTRTNTIAYKELMDLKSIRDGTIPPWPVKIVNPSIKEDKLETVIRVLNRRFNEISKMKRDKLKHMVEATNISVLSKWIDHYLKMMTLKRKLKWMKDFKSLINYDKRLRIDIPLVEIMTETYSEKSKTLLEMLSDCERKENNGENEGPDRVSKIDAM